MSKGFGRNRRTSKIKIALRGIRLALGQNVPDSSQDHFGNSNDGFLVSAIGFDTAITDPELGMVFGVDESVSDLNEKRFQIGTGAGNASALDVFGTLIISWTAAGPGNKMLGSREDRHISTDLGEDKDRGKGVPVKAGNSTDEIKGRRIRFSQKGDLVLDLRFERLNLIDMRESGAEFDGLLRTDGAVNSSLDLLDRSFASTIDIGSDVKGFARMSKDMLGNGTGGLSKDVGKDIVEFKIGNGQTIQCTVLLAGNHVGEFGTITHQITQVTYISRRNKTWFDHVTHKEIADPFRVLAVRLVTLLRFCIFRVSKSDETGMLQDVEYRDPVLPGGLHADLVARV